MPIKWAPPVLAYSFFLFDLVYVSEIETLAPEDKVWSQLCLAFALWCLHVLLWACRSNVAHECPHEQNNPVLLHLAFSHTSKFLNAQPATFSSCETDNTKKYRCLRILISMDVSGFYSFHLWHRNIKVTFKNEGFMTNSHIRKQKIMSTPFCCCHLKHTMPSFQNKYRFWKLFIQWTKIHCL